MFGFEVYETIIFVEYTQNRQIYWMSFALDTMEKLSQSRYRVYILKYTQMGDTFRELSCPLFFVACIDFGYIERYYRDCVVLSWMVTSIVDCKKYCISG